ncbi:MAG: hypothetical protein FWG38_10700 [Defluviitaleaceae bacterium]|nr:hypothetical protein [Defluviitaleaceae bacterium]
MAKTMARPIDAAAITKVFSIMAGKDGSANRFVKLTNPTEALVKMPWKTEVSRVDRRAVWTAGTPIKTSAINIPTIKNAVEAILNPFFDTGHTPSFILRLLRRKAFAKPAGISPN